MLPNAGLNVYDILRRKTLVLTREAVEGVNARFAEDREGVTDDGRRRKRLALHDASRRR